MPPAINILKLKKNLCKFWRVSKNLEPSGTSKNRWILKFEVSFRALEPSHFWVTSTNFFFSHKIWKCGEKCLPDWPRSKAPRNHKTGLMHRQFLLNKTQFNWIHLMVKVKLIAIIVESNWYMYVYLAIDSKINEWMWKWLVCSFNWFYYLFQNIQTYR